MTKFKTVIAIAVGTLFAGAAFAQSNYSIEQRDRFQDQRIDRGVESGQITSREAARLQGEQAQVERIERRARADGALTPFERARIDHAQDRFGRDIYRQSHDRQVANSDGRRGDDRRHGWDRGNGWDRSNGWDRRNDRRVGHFDQRGRSEHFNRGEAGRGERNEARGNGVAASTGTNANFGRSDRAPGRQPHQQQSTGQSTQVQQAQTQRTWTRPAQASRPTTTASADTTARQGDRSGRSTN